MTAKINKLNRNFRFAIGTIAACTISGCQVNYKTAYGTINPEIMAKKCLDLLETNPAKIEINEQFGVCKKEPKSWGVWGSGNEQKANLAVQKQMQLLLVAKAKKEAKRSEQAITKYGKYAKETEFMTSGEFCEEMTDPAASFIYSSVPGGGWQYWSKIIEGRYTVLGLETTTRQDKQQLKNAYKTWKKVLNNCDW